MQQRLDITNKCNKCSRKFNNNKNVKNVVIVSSKFLKLSAEHQKMKNFTNKCTKCSQQLNKLIKKFKKNIYVTKAARHVTNKSNNANSIASVNKVAEYRS